MAPASSLLLQEHFESGSEDFLQTLLESTAGGSLKAFASKWVKDERPFAREMLLRYIDDGCDRPGHRPLVKALYKVFEARGDEASDEVMAHFFVAFDRLPRRRLVQKHGWDRASRSSYQYSELAPERGIPANDWQRMAQARAFETQAPMRNNASWLPRFSAKTRQYLKRRALRYFRRFGRKDPERYRRGLVKALRLYQDEHLQKAAQFLDSWGLVHALYWGSPVLSRHAWQGAKVAEGQSLANLHASPMFPSAWKSCRDDLVDLLIHARSRTVRVWAPEWLKSAYGPADLQSIPTSQLRRMLSSQNEEAQLFAAELLKGASGLEALPIADWFDLLKVQNPALIGAICELVEKNVAPNRLTLAQCVELACSPMAPVAQLGLKWARGKPARNAIDIGVLMQLGGARAAVVRTESAHWLCELLLTSEQSRDEHLRELIDSRYEDIRGVGLRMFPMTARFRDSLLLWAALAESPHDDARAVLAKYLGEREKTLEPEALRHVWATALLAVNKGGRAKQMVLNRVANRIATKPGEAEALLPLLAIALRSVRAPERRGALAAVASAATRTPSLQAAIAKKLPDLVLHEGLPV